MERRHDYGFCDGPNFARRKPPDSATGGVHNGNLNVDAHRARPLPAGVFYGEMNGE